MSAESFLILVGDDPAAISSLASLAQDRLTNEGWIQRLAFPFLQVFTPADGRLEVTGGLDGHGVLIGEMFDREGRPLTAQERAVCGCRPLDTARAQAVVSELWGRYVLVRRTSGDVAVLRDPSGALEAVSWRRDGVTITTSHPEAAFDPLLPEDLEIDWLAVANLVRRAGEYRHSLPLKGLTPIAAGELRTLGARGSVVEQIWRPAEIYRAARQRERPDLRVVVERAVRALAGDRIWVAEVSGGLDSAIIAGALKQSQREQVSAWVNHYVEQPEGDERQYARPVVEQFGFTLSEVRREKLGLSADRLAQSAGGFRPAINDIDPDYNDDIAMRIAKTGAWGSLTGQGGDAVFFQMPSPLIAFDEIRERGIGARLAVLHRIARWTRRSLWPRAWVSAWRQHRRSRDAWDHPWLEDLRGVPPAKALQISVLSFCQTFQGQAVRSRHGACVNPLLSQPVLEAGLAWSTVDLTWGGRDRAAARSAFQNLLPPALYARRSKGELGAYYGEAVADQLPFLRSYLLDGALAKAGLLDPAMEERLTREALLWRGGYTTILSLALTEAWVRHWQDRLARRQA
ncbi:asparagine synthase-related protein [Brevundimonas variabilis]|uniref:Asparagine synthase (Glutamine-hydrolyzing) n=1 Tax=Brevundimonas variabilis TaxID=74312 RepID=A0A7W9CJ62_9CAUL|nr:asparagine synthase-related protein [Brevundimonas variabilis]MBB5746536.1 asparagine synthase (glutamine-hydrolyzing) [Brevundimonas variabilis]